MGDKKRNLGSQSRSEIGKIWNLLPYEEKAKFREPDVVEVAARNMPAEQPQHRDNDIPNNFDLPLMDEEIHATTNHMGHEDQTINTRRLQLKICLWLVDNFDTKVSALDIHGRRFAINSSVFSRVLGISDQGDQICLSGDVPNFDFWKSKFSITSRGIFLKDIEHSLEEMTTADDEFKVTVCLFLLGTILCPSTIDYVQTGYLIPLGDAGSIGTKNWSSWCFSALCEGTVKFQKNWQRLKTCCISRFVLFLELFYFHSLQWDPPMVDKSVTPVICWTNVKIKKCVTRLHTERGVGANQISVDDFFNQLAPAEGQYDAAAHGETSHANHQPGTCNNAYIKSVHDVLQVVKEIQATLKSELSDIRTKVNFLYEKYNLPGDKNSKQDLHKANSHQKSKHHGPPNPSPNSPPPPPSQPLSIPTLEHPIVEIWDSNPPRRKDDLSRLNQFRKLMQSLDIVLADDIVVAFPTSFSFTSFSISYAEAPNQPNGYDCGLFLCMFMDENCPTPVQMKTHYNKLVSNNEVVPTVKMRPPPMKKLKGKAAARME
ncbi:hypothetical protein EZV62_012229 [Acer yangbiense]|uniref:Ubiquitin-like protease family profile domain-containing protein n=1 Tax=Acer yangbiense TaxID=1000413 RepID=A0A5C7HX05_9ROSI|nr:hypothetical protein EZV62_012229 [Acer yangbiense]